MKNIYYLFYVIIFFGCKEEKRPNFRNRETNIDSLLIASRGENLEEVLRLEYLKEARNALPDRNYDTILRNNYVGVITEYFYSSKNYEYYKASEELERRAILANDLNGNIQAKFFIGNYFLKQYNIDSAFYYYTKAEKLSGRLKETPFLCSILIEKASILFNKKDFLGSEVLAIRALRMARSKKDNLLTYSCYILLGNSSAGLKNYDQALEYYNKGKIELAKSTDDPQYDILNAQNYNYISLVYQYKNDYENAMSYASKGLSKNKIDKSKPVIYCYLTNNLAYSKFKLGDKTALRQFQETLRIGDSIKNIPIQITSKTFLGEFFLAEQDTVKAILYLKEVRQQAHINNIFDDELQILQLLAQANPASRSFYSERYITLSDSLQTVERATRNKFARIEFETDEITDERNSLTIERETLLMERWLIAGVSVLSLLSAFLWFKNESQKSKTRELLLTQEQQKANEEIYQLMLIQQQKLEEGKNSEKQRISLELHDGVMGKLSAVRLNLYASLYKANLLGDESVLTQIDEIQSVEKEIRNIAHDLSVNLFSDNSNFIEMVKVLFAQIENHSEIQFDLQVSDAVNWDAINNAVKINLYRILQEALQNIEKYADASEVSVTMHLSDLNEIKVVVSDNGNGFDPSQTRSGIGLSNMKIRTKELNGEITIDSRISSGTKINLKIPV